MDHEADLCAQRPDAIHHRIDDTRDRLTEKLEALEQKVMQTVADAREAVTTTVAGVKQAVKDTVHDGVESVKHGLNPGPQVRRHPWTMFAGSMAAGYVIGRLLPPAHPVRRPLTASQSETDLPQLPAKGIKGPMESRVPWVNGFSRLKETLAPEMQQLKSLALAALLDLTRDTIKRSIGPALGPELASVIDRVTRKLEHEFEGLRHPGTQRTT